MKVVILLQVIKKYKELTKRINREKQLRIISQKIGMEKLLMVNEPKLLRSTKGRHQNFGEVPYLYIVKINGGRG